MRDFRLSCEMCEIMGKSVVPRILKNVPYKINYYFAFGGSGSLLEGT